MPNLAFHAQVSFLIIVEYLLYLKAKTGKEIHNLSDIYGSAASSNAKVKFWITRFKGERSSVDVETKSGCTLDSTNE